MEIKGFSGVTQFRPVKRFLSNVGSREKISYSASYDDKGRIVLKESGKENLYDYIQSFAESCDINVLLKRYANGDVDVLSKVQGFYGDITEFPTTYAEMLNRVIEGENFFNDLPLDIRSKFGHSYSQFLASIGTPEFFEAMGVSKSDVEEPAEKAVVPDAVKEVKEGEAAV